jgi:hypothetical protein
MATFPTLSSGVTTIGPLSFSESIPSEILTFENGAEQRFRTAKKLYSFKLRFDGIKKSDMALLRDFFITVKGSFDTTWSIAIDGVTYQNMTFTTEVFSAEEAARGRYTVALECRQVK